jgi:hypothetical protein
VRARYVLSFVVGVFLVSLLVSVVFVETVENMLTETRRFALIRALSQQDFNAFHEAQSLSVVAVFGGLQTVDLEKKIDFIVSEECLETANQTLWNWPIPIGGFGNVSYINELYGPYVITSVLKQFGAINRINRTALVNLVMERYNATEGAFRELPFTVQESLQERQYALCFFPLEEQAYSHGGYADSNIISTFLAVSILANLEALDEINVTKTLNWVLACEAKNRIFRPSPKSTDMFYYLNRGFYVDYPYGTGIAYTYAALSTLRIFGVNVYDAVDTEKIREYVISCKETWNGEVEFQPYLGDLRTTDFYSTYYAIMILNQIGALKNETETISGVIAYIRWLQDLHLYFIDSWPIPTRSDSEYGLFYYHDLPTEAYLAATILNVTNSLDLLDEHTPIVSRAWNNLFGLSVLTTFVATIVLLAASGIHKWRQKPEAPKTSETQTQTKERV